MRRKTRLRLELLEARVLLTGQTDFLVNTTLAGNQLDPAVAADGQGNFIAVWDGFNPANGTTDVFGQRYHADGTPSGGEFLVNTITAGTQQFPKVAADAVGDFVVVWTGPNPANGKTDVWGRRFNSSGNAVTPADVLLDAGTEGLDSGARVALSGDGSHVVVARTGKVGGVPDIYAQLYDGSFNPTGSAFRVNQVHSASQSSSRLAMDPAGNFVVTWNTLASNGLTTVSARRFDSQGNALTGDLPVSGTPVGGNQTNLALAVAPDGGFLSTWDAVNPTTNNLEVHALRFGAANQPGTPFLVSAPATSADFAAAAFDAAGNSTIAWQTQGTGSPVPDAVYAQGYDPAGNPSGPVVQLNVQPASDLTSVMLAEAPGGSTLAVWPSLNADHSTDVRGTFTAAAARPPVLTGLTGTTDGSEGGTFAYHATATDPNGDPLTYSWDLNGDGVFGDATGPDVQTVFTNAGQHNVSVQVTDAHGLSAVGCLAVTVENVAPTVSAGPLVTLSEGGTAAFQGSFADPGQPSETYTTFWDFNYDGVTFNPQASGLTAQHTYTRPGSYVAALEVLDGHGGAGIGTATVQVNDAPLGAQPATLAAVEGQDTGPVTVATFTDADPNATAGNYTATVDWGDGTSSAGTVTADGQGGFVVTGDHLYADEGSYAAHVTIADGGGSTTAADSPVTVADAALAATGTAVAAVEGTAFSGAVASFTDANPGAAAGDFTVTIAWGDGTTSAGTVTANGASGFVVSGGHAYAEEGSYSALVTITDVGGGTTQASTGVAVADATLTAAGRTISATEGASFSGVVGSFTDANPTGPLADYSATITWGDGATSPGSIAPDGNGGYLVTGSHIYAEEGSYAVGLTIADVGGGSATATDTATVADAALTATGRAVSATEGASFSGVVGSFTDGDPNATAADYRATITWGDGGTSAGSITPDGSGGFLVSGSHAYTEAASYAVGLTVTDVGGGSATATGTATVADAPLHARPAAPSAQAGVPFRGVLASFTDANPAAALGSFAATIAWGDGTTSAGTVAANGQGGFDVSGSHTYPAAGSFALSVTVADVGGSTATAGGTVAVTAAAQPIQPGESASAGFWRGWFGQALLLGFNGGPRATRLGNWLAAAFPNLYGPGAGKHNLAGKTNAQVAGFYRGLFAFGQPGLPAEVLTTALNVYATTLSLGGLAGALVGFRVTADGLGPRTVNVGNGGAPFGVADNTTEAVSQLLAAADRQAVQGMPWGGDGALQGQAEAVFAGVNAAGGVTGSWGGILGLLFGGL